MTDFKVCYWKDGSFGVCWIKSFYPLSFYRASQMIGKRVSVWSIELCEN